MPNATSWRPFAGSSTDSAVCDIACGSVSSKNTTKPEVVRVWLSEGGVVK